ncbi:MAG: DUF927 domain-containing protein [Endozoicomonas sp.]|uniref:DUF927 domain-containing protein n=1 Tax=Endozoicomonas sp. TaxID=1892382 RepID=UPI003D9ACCFD
MYEKVRFITITGHVVDGKYLLSQDQEALKALYLERLDIEPKPVQQPVKPAAPLEMDDQALIAAIKKSKQGGKFEALMAGDRSSYANKDNDGWSEADMAHCCVLAWWTRKDPERMDRFFRCSKLIRPKWDEMRGGQTYGQMTIESAIKNTRGEYDPEKHKNNVISIKRSRKVQTTSTGFTEEEVLFHDPVPWPDTGSEHFIDAHSGALFRGQPWGESHNRDLIALRPIWVHSLANDEFGASYRVIKFFNENYEPRAACYPAKWFTKTKDALVWGDLLEQGMIMMSGKEKYVSRYLDLMTHHSKIRSWAASKLGWFEVPGQEESPVFVLPDKIIGNTGDGREIFFQQQQEVASKTISSRGKLSEWKTEIADKAKGNYLIMFCIAAGLAGGMTKLSGTPSGGFHFWGLSRSGKTALMQCAASVWGNGSDPQVYSSKTSIRKWNATANGLEATAQLHNDIVLCLDEIGELDAQELGKLIYTLTGGTPKGRSVETGGLRNQTYWHIMLLSSGEQSTEQILKSVGQNKRGGQLHRMPDIRVDALENGIVQTDDDPSDLVDHLKDSSGKFYGTAGPVFISYLLSQLKEKGYKKFRNEILDNVKTMKVLLMSGDVPKSNEVEAVLKRMAAIAVAAMYASEAKILDWPPHLINDCMVFIRDLWISDMEDDVSELDRALSELRSNIISNLANFEDLATDYNYSTFKQPVKLMGYKDNEFIMILPKSMDDFCTYSKRQILNELKVRKYLEPGEFDKSKGKARVAKKIPVRIYAKERPRCYYIRREFLND